MHFETRRSSFLERKIGRSAACVASRQHVTKKCQKDGYLTWPRIKQPRTPLWITQGHNTNPNQWSCLPSCRRACKQAKKFIDTKGAHHGLTAKPTFPNKRYLFSNAAAAFVDVECPDDSINTRRSSRWGSQDRTGGGAKTLVSLPRWQCRMTAFPFVIQLHWDFNWSRRGCFSLSGETTVALAESQQPDMRKSKKKSHIFTWRNPGLGGAWWCLHVRAVYEPYHHLPWNENLHTITSLNKFKGDTGYFNVRLNSACILNIAALFP